MTVSDIVTRARLNLDDLSGKFYSDIDYLDSVQDGYATAVTFGETRESQATINLTANLTYYDLITLIPDFYKVVAIWSNQLKRYLDPINDRELDEQRDNWETEIGEPREFWVVNHRYIAIHPKPSTTVGTLIVFYKQIANTLGLTDTPDIPVETHTSLEKYSTSDLLDQLEEFQKSLSYREEWIKDLSQIKELVQKRTYPDKLPALKELYR